MSNENRINDLAESVRHHNKLYWIEHKPEISDEEYDQLVEELRGLAPFHQVLSEFDEDSSSRGKITHEVPMLSLDKVFTAEDVLKWAGNAFEGEQKGVICSAKIDGLSCSLLYENGKLIRAATRGNGKQGDDVTANVLAIKDIPTVISTERKVEIRGEIYMTRKSFKENIKVFEKKLSAGKVNEDERPSNARNFCAGSLKQKDPSITKERNLSFFAHGLILHSGQELASEDNLMFFLKKIGFSTPYQVAVYEATDLQKTIKGVEDMRSALDYDTDGIVMSINNLKTQKQLGCTSHHPRGKIAFKFGRERGETEIKGINWETSRTGRVVPTIELIPICLGGAKVTFCTGHNAKNIKDNELWPSSCVLMEREVIPYLVNRTKGASKQDNLPSKCPSCGTGLEWDDTQTDLCCPNSGGCPAQLLEYLIHYVSRKVTNIMGLGDEIMHQLVEKGLVYSPADLYALTADKIIKTLDRQGEASAQKIVDSIQSRREQSLATFLYSLGIPNLGNTVSEKLAEHFKDLTSVLKASKEDLKVEKVGEIMSEGIYNGLKSRTNLIKDLLKHVTIIQEIRTDGVLSGKSFCLTGHVEFEFDGKTYEARPEIESLIKAHGGSIKSVSKGLDYLIAGDDSGSKLEKANKLGIKVIDSNGFVSMLK